MCARARVRAPARECVCARAPARSFDVEPVDGSAPSMALSLHPRLCPPLPLAPFPPSLSSSLTPALSPRRYRVARHVASLTVGTEPKEVGTEPKEDKRQFFTESLALDLSSRISLSGQLPPRLGRVGGTGICIESSASNPWTESFALNR